MRETIQYVPYPEDINEKAWNEAYRRVARGPKLSGIEALRTAQRLKELILSGDPEGQHF